MIQQTEFTLRPMPRGFHVITGEVMSNLPPLPETGLLNLFVRHTSCALCICENADPDVRTDLESIYDRLIPENQPFYQHTLEGSDDMPSHAKSVITGVSINIPIARGRLRLGMWQGIYMCEFRDGGSHRNIIATIIS